MAGSRRRLSAAGRGDRAARIAYARRGRAGDLAGRSRAVAVARDDRENLQNGSASVAMVMQTRAYSMAPSRYLGVMGLVFPPPLLVLFVLAFGALAVFYLER